MATKKVTTKTTATKAPSATTTRTRAVKKTTAKEMAPSPVAPDAPVPSEDRAPVAAMVPMVKMPVAVTHEAIAKRAYELWCDKGYPHGTHEQNWLEAEAQLRAETSRTLARH